MKVFPLSPLGKVILIFIALALGMIWSMLQWPEKWRKWFRKDDKEQKDKR